MSGRRFQLLFKYLHLNDSEKQPSNYDRHYKIQPFLDLIVQNFKEAYISFENISIDESIVGYKGRLSWIQYIQNKPTKWGIKAWILAESDTGYVWNFRLYTGNAGTNANHIRKSM